MEDLGRLSAYRGKRVLLTGHTGFKGSWLALWLHELGAEVTGFALAPDTQPNAFEALRTPMRSVIGDVRDRHAVEQVVEECKPDFVFHLAAQALVRRSYREPEETWATNVLGTAHLLGAVRGARVVVVTSDKCYENPGDGRALSEDARLGGHDPYSASKAAQEMVVESYRASFGMHVASARAGNVIGGGDWAEDRILPDAMRTLLRGHAVPVRNPRSTRPWQHVIEPLYGYLLLGASSLDKAFNFGPDSSATVSELVDAAIAANGGGAWEHKPPAQAVHEAPMLALSSARAKAELGWRPRWSMEEAVRRSVEWYKAHARGEDVRALSARQIAAYLEAK